MKGLLRIVSIPLIEGDECLLTHTALSTNSQPEKNIKAKWFLQRNAHSIAPPMCFHLKITNKASRGWNFMTRCFSSHSSIGGMAAKEEGNRVGKLQEGHQGTWCRVRTHHGWRLGWGGCGLQDLKAIWASWGPMETEAVGPRQGGICGPKRRQCVEFITSEVHSRYDKRVWHWTGSFQEFCIRKQNEKEEKGLQFQRKQLPEGSQATARSPLAGIFILTQSQQINTHTREE